MPTKNFAGIDLGTTNSAIATFDGTVAEIVPNSLGESLTPSVVRLDKDGRSSVGRSAQRWLDSDSANTRAEFKRLMGTEERLGFARCQQTLSPEQLSALVLESLLADAEVALGYRPMNVVVSIPALFELPQSHATVRAAKRAGLREVQLIQEPIASAIAAGWQRDAEGVWMIFDLGGGTFDISLLESEDGWLRVLDHDGDNFLGGKDLDRILLDWALESLDERGVELPPLHTPVGARALAKLKLASETARIELSRVEKTAILIPELWMTPEGEPVEVDLPIQRGKLEELIEPLVARCLSVCTSLLEANHRSPDDVEQVVFVGGPTLTPVIRRRVGEVFGGRIAEDIDPMTVVARGAALFAGTLGLEARPAAAQPKTMEGLKVRLEYPPATADLEPFVVGRLTIPDGKKVPTSVHLVREDGWKSSPGELDLQSTFVLQASLQRRSNNLFRVVALDAQEDEIQLAGSEFQIVQGLSIADPPLARTIGVARSNDEVAVYFRKGTPLPARRSAVYRTTSRVTAGSTDGLLSIPVVQGERERAHNNRLIGRLEVTGDQLDKTLPLGTEIRVTLELDRSGTLKAGAEVPYLGQTFEEVIHVLVDSATPEVLSRELESAERRVAAIRAQGFGGGATGLLRAMQGAEGQLAEARQGVAAALFGDPDAAARTHRLLLDLNGSLDEAEIGAEWPEVEARVDGDIGWALSWISGWGTAAEQGRAERALASANEARLSTDVIALERHAGTLMDLANIALRRDPLFPEREMTWYEGRLSEALDPAHAVELIEQGRRAMEGQDATTAKNVVRQLSALFPGTSEERRLSFDSGVY